MKRRSLVAALAAGLLAVCVAAVPARADAPIRILTLGDSITAQCGATPPAGYCGPLGQLLDQAGVPHVFVSEAVSGTDCGYTASNIHTFLTRDLPSPSPNDVVLVECGTNNVPGTAGSPSANALGTQWRTIVEAVHGYGVRLGVSFIYYSSPNNISAFHASLPSDEANANDEIYRNLMLYPAGWFTGVADFQALPGTRDYLLDDGMHPNSLGYQRMAQIWYRSLSATMGWPAIPAPCGMWGARPTPPTVYVAPAPFAACVATS
jgi:lysophospholipase L1-like esterase